MAVNSRWLKDLRTLTERFSLRTLVPYSAIGSIAVLLALYRVDGVTVPANLLSILIWLWHLPRDWLMWWWKVPVFEKVIPRNLAWLVYERGCDFSGSKKMGMDSISLNIAGFLWMAKTCVFLGSNLMHLVLVQLLSWTISFWVMSCSLSTFLCVTATAVSSAWTDVLLCGLMVVGISPV